MKKLTSLLSMIVFGAILSGCALQQGVLDEKQAELEAKSKPVQVQTPAAAVKSTIDAVSKPAAAGQEKPSEKAPSDALPSE